MAKTMADEAKRKNGIDPAALKKWIGQIELIDKEDLDAHMEYMNAKSSNAAERVELFKAAKEEGIPTKELKVMIKKRKLETRLKDMEEALDLDQRSIYFQMVEALGGARGLAGLPLAAAKEKEAGADLTKEEKDAIAAEANAKALGIGIKKTAPKDKH